jgi:hypothetical protein
VKLLKRGWKQQGWAMERTCSGAGYGGGGCGALLLVEEGDLFLTESHVRDETTTYITFVCSECGVRTDINNAVIPAHVRAKLRSYEDWAKHRAKRSTGDQGEVTP